MDNYILIFIGLIITIVAQVFVSGSYAKYKKIANKSGVTGFDVAKKILESNGLGDIYVTEIKGNLTDHYDPARKVIRLSTEVYHGNSIASASVAAHEVGHAIQDKEGYSFMRFRSKLFPLVNFSSYAGYFAVMIGLIFGLTDFIWIGIALEVIILLFQLVTLPVEFDASKRAKEEMEKQNLLSSSEIKGSDRMLKAAAFTYVASVLTTILQILRLIGIADRDN